MYFTHTYESATKLVKSTQIEKGGENRATNSLNKKREVQMDTKQIQQFESKTINNTNPPARH